MELIHSLADDIKELLHPSSSDDARLVQKGLMLYRQGMVHHLHINDYMATAVVQDVTPCKVELDLNFLGLSECSCPGKDLCRHQMAVFFAAYSTVGSVTTWVEEWREPVMENKTLTSWGIQKAKDLIKANGVLKPDYESWVRSFEDSFDALMQSKKYMSPFTVADLFEIYERRLAASAPLEQEWRLLYELIGTVVSFRKLAVLSEQSRHTEDLVKRAYLHLFYQMIDDVEDLVAKIGVQSLPFDFDEFILKLKDDTFTLLTCVTGLEQERISVYRLLWSGLFRNKTWREEETEKIRLALKDLRDSENPLPLLIASVHLHFLRGDDVSMLNLLKQIEDDIVTPHMLHWIDQLTQLKAWKRVGPMIELFSQKIRGYLEKLQGYHTCTGFTREAMKAIAPYCAETGRTDLFERALLQSLPYSYADYEYMLFERGHYDRWGELQAFVGLSYADLPSSRVKTVEKERPEVLLGILHQTVQAEIDQKNRPSYKQATRHLKKLRTLYKKMKRQDDWHYFLQTLLERTKRLRAFHEECQRAKLTEQ